MIRLATHCRTTLRQNRRKGTVVPFLIATMLVLLLVAAWVIDRAWVSSAYGEMVLAAESAAHAGAVELLDDTRLLGVGDELRLRRARYAAAEMAASNFVAGSPVIVDPTRDVLFSKSVGEDWQPDVIDARVVTVICGRSNARGNRLGLLLSGIGGVDSTEIEYVSRVRIENELTGLHADADRPLAMLPLGIIATGAEGVMGWNEAIEQRLGDDRYRYIDETRSVEEVPDGLPEIAVVIDTTADANARFVSGVGFDTDTLTDVVARGYTAHPIDFASFGQLDLSALPNAKVIDSLEASHTLGKKRVLFVTDGNAVVQAVAGRVMAVESDAHGRSIAIVQPCVMALGQAVVAKTSHTLPKDNIAESDAEPNPYLFKLITVR